LIAGKVLSKADLEKAGGFARYKDVDGDGVGYRTLPGTQHPAAAYFARGSGHNEKAQYSERPDDFERNMERINKKFETARRLCRAELMGAARRRSALSLMALRTGRLSRRAISYRKTTNWRRTIFECCRSVHARGARLYRASRRVYVVEQNRDGQMATLLSSTLARIDAAFAVDLPISMDCQSTRGR